MITMQDIVRRWARRAALALFAGGLASSLFYALGFVRVGLSTKLLGDAYRLAYRFIDNRQLDRHGYAQVLILNAVLYAICVLVAFAAKDLLVLVRDASPSGWMRRLVTFCLIQAFGICLVLIEIDPGDALGAFLLLPGFAAALFRNGGGAAYFLSITLCVNAIAWLAGYTLLGRFKPHRETSYWR